MLHWNKSGLNALDRKSRKTMTKYGALHPESDVTTLCIKRKEGSRGLIGVERCVREEENSLGYYVANSGENLIRGVAAAGTIRIAGIITSGQFQKQREQELEQKWTEKRMHSKFVGENALES